MALRHHPDSVQSWGDSRGFGLLIDSVLSLVVAPSDRGMGLGTSLLESASLPSPVEAWSHGSHPGAAALGARFGFTHDRSLWKMARSADAPTIGAWQVPDGVSLRGYRDTDAEALLRVNAAAFSFHPEQGEMDADDLAQRVAEPWFDPDGLLLAVSQTGDLLGFHWTKEHSDTEGEVYVIGVAPHAQGGGLGRTLLLAGLDHLTARGRTSVHLYVEANNAPAIALYGSFGFKPVETHAHYSR
ncbi:hypothetical protein BH09ACT11_BH09ACT11_17930 [soil metagenome]